MIDVLLFEDACDIPEVALVPRFFEKSKFVENYIFGRCNVDCTGNCLDSSGVCERPLKTRVVSGKIDVGFEAGLVMNDVEMTVDFTPGFDGDDCSGRKVVFVFVKKVREMLNLARIGKDDQIDVECVARFTVDRTGDRACDHVANTRFFEWGDE